jgi:anti-sigma B factor antagonist
MDPILDSPSALRIDERRVGDVTVLSLTGALLVDDGDLAFRKRIHELTDAGRVKLVLDLGGITSIDSSGVGMMVAKLNSVRAAGGDIKLVHMTSRSLRLLGTMKILSVFATFDDEASAVASFSRR